MKKALVTGCTGQDGYFLTQFLLKKGYQVHGLVRRNSQNSLGNLDKLPIEIKKQIKIHYGDITDTSYIDSLIKKEQFDELYHLAAQSFVALSFNNSKTTYDINIGGTLNIANAVKEFSPKTKVYFAATSELFGKTEAKKQNEKTVFYPKSPYGISKLAGFWTMKNYRENYKLFMANGILFNHESEVRGPEFVSRKISLKVADIVKTGSGVLELGNIDSQRDWGYARDYCINKDVPLLTPRGWKYHDELVEGDSIINFNTKTDSLEEDIINKKIYTECNGEKIIIKGRGTYLKCTKNHRLLYQYKSKKSKGGWSDWKIITAEQLYNTFSNINYRTKYDYRFPHFSKYNKLDYTNINDDEISLIGYLLAEGNLSRCIAERSIRISISQSYLVNENKHKKIKDTLNRLKLIYNEKNRNDGVTEWVFNAESSRRILKLFDTLDIHILPKYIYNFSQRQFNILFNALMDCDGHWPSLRYTSKRYLLATDFQTIAHLAGYRTSSISKNNNCYVVNAIVKYKKYTYIQSVDLINDKITDVWCVNTNNGSIITRDNDSIFISGNCEAMWEILQQDIPDDFVICTGKVNTIRKFVEESFKVATGKNIIWKGKGVNEVGILDGKIVVRINPEFYRPNDVTYLCGDCRKAKKILGWAPKTSFKELVKIMVNNDLGRV